MSPFGPPLLLAALAAAIVSHRYRAASGPRSVALAAVTVVFWAVFDASSALALLLVSLLAWLAARAIAAREPSSATRRWVRRTSVLSVIVAMATVRYTPSIVERFVEQGWLERPVDTWWQPLGVGVMTLQVISYLVDVDRREAKPGSFPEALLVIGFFPRAFAGPIVRTSGFVAQLRRPFDGTVPLGEVAQRVMSAVIKSYVLAETLLRYEVATTGTSTQTGRLDALLHLAVGPLRFFLDISALTDLAIAVGLCCGLRLPENFKSPFRARTVGGLFRGWHTTISGFFRDYVFANVAGTSGSKVRVMAASIVTLVLIGVWHHPTAGSVLWGLAMGVPIGVEIARQRSRPASRASRLAAPGPNRVRAALARAAVFAYMAFISPLYNGSTLASVGRVWSGIGNDWTATRMYSPWVVACAVLAYLVGSGTFARPAHVTQAALDRMPAWAVGVCAALVVTAAAGLAGAGVPSFLYQRM